MEGDRGHSTALRQGDHLGTWRSRGGEAHGDMGGKHGTQSGGEAHEDMVQPQGIWGHSSLGTLGPGVIKVGKGP